MDIIITETGERRELSILDRSTCNDYAADLIGRDTDLPPYDDAQQAQPMTTAQYDWWADVLARLQTATDRQRALSSTLTAAQATELEEDIAACGCDLEDEPGVIARCCDRAEFDCRIKALGWTIAETAVNLGLSKSSIDKRLSGAVAVRPGELAALAHWANQ